MANKSDSVKKQIIEQLSAFTVLEMSELVKELESLWGVSASASVMAAPALAVSLASAGDEAASEQDSEFDVVLKGSSDPSNQIPLIKELKGLCGLSLRDSKETVEEVCGGKSRVVKFKVEKAEAEALAVKLRAASAIVEIVASTD